MDLQKEREAFEAFFYENCMFQWEQDLSEMFFQVLENNEYEYDYARVQSSWLSWQAAKAQAVQSKQDLLDRVNARWQLAHEQCAENWNTYSSAQMDAFDWVEQDIKELLGEAQEPNND